MTMLLKLLLTLCCQSLENSPSLYFSLPPSFRGDQVGCHGHWYCNYGCWYNNTIVSDPFLVTAAKTRIPLSFLDPSSIRYCCSIFLRGQGGDRGDLLCFLSGNILCFANWHFWKKKNFLDSRFYFNFCCYHFLAHFMPKTKKKQKEKAIQDKDTVVQFFLRFLLILWPFFSFFSNFC